MSFDTAFILVVFVIPGALGLLCKFWGWVTEERYWRHRKTQFDYLKEKWKGDF